MSLIFKCIKSGWSLATRRGSRIRLGIASALLIFAILLPATVAAYLNITVFGYNAQSHFMEYVLVYGIVAIFSLMATVPVCAAYFSYTYGIYSKARYGAVYTKRKRGAYGYFRDLFGGMILMLRGGVCAIALQTAYLLTAYAEIALKIDKYGIPMIVLCIPLMTVAIGFCLIFLWLTSGFFLAPYYFARGERLFTALVKSHKAIIAHPFLKDGYALIFLILIALSVFTLGVALVLWVMPIMMLTYFTLAEYIDGGELPED